LISINRTNVAIEIDGRPRSRRALPSLLHRPEQRQIPQHPIQPRQILRQLPRLEREHLLPQALHLPAAQREHHTSAGLETNS
jgi:hypothetical protein